MKVPFTPTPSDGTEGATCVCSLQGILTDFPSVTAYDVLGMYSEGAASHPTMPSPTSSHSRVCLLSPLWPTMGTGVHRASLPPPHTHTTSSQHTEALGCAGWGLWCWKTEGSPGPLSSFHLMRETVVFASSCVLLEGRRKRRKAR